MTDRELLELAAKAYGVEVEFDADGVCWKHWPSFKWNPLEDDGDALRLAVRLGFTLSINLHHRFVTCNDVQISYDEAKFGGVCDVNRAV